MPLHPNACLMHQGVFTRKEIVDRNPTHVKVRVVCAFVVGPTCAEEFWCKVHLIGKKNKPLVCSVDNELEYTEKHGLKADDALEIQPDYIKEILTP